VYVSPGPLAHSGARAFWLGGVCSVGQLSEDGRGTGSVGDVVVERRIRWCYGPCGHCGITRKVRRSAVPVLQLLAVQPPTLSFSHPLSPDGTIWRRESLGSPVCRRGSELMGSSAFQQAWRLWVGLAGLRRMRSLRGSSGAMSGGRGGNRPREGTCASCCG
jgi:hypothetical protein